MTKLEPILECVLQRRSDLSLEWMENAMARGCPCDEMIVWNMGRIHMYCEYPDVYERGVFTQFFYNSIFAILILLAIAGNAAVVWIILRHEQMRTTTNYYLLNLAIADLLITILNTGFNATYNLYYNWLFSETHCAFNNFMGIAPLCASVFTMTMMSIDRYLAIVHPLKSRPNRQKTVAIICVIWVLAIICGFPAIMATKLHRNYFIDMYHDTVYERHECLDDKFPDGNADTSILFTVYNNFLVVIQYIVPLLILSFTYGRISTVLQTNMIIGDSVHHNSVKAKKKASNMLASIVLLFNFVWLPYNVYFLCSYFMDFNAQAKIYVFLSSYCIRLTSALLNPIIYYFMNERFKIGFHYAFRWIPWVKVNHDHYKKLFYMNRTSSSNV